MYKLDNLIKPRMPGIYVHTCNYFLWQISILLSVDFRLHYGDTPIYHFISMFPSIMYNVYISWTFFKFIYAQRTSIPVD